MNKGTRLLLCVALGVGAAWLAMRITGPPSKAMGASDVSPTSAGVTPSEIHSGGDHAAAQHTGIADVQPETLHLANVAANAEVRLGPTNASPAGIGDQSALADRVGSEHASFAAGTSYTVISAAPLSWCFRAHGSFTWQEMNAGRAPQHSMSTDTSVVWQGSASARIDAANDSIPLEGVGVMWQAVAAAPFRGKRVEVSAYARPRLTHVGHFFVRTQASAPLELWLSDQGTPGARGINQYIARHTEWDRYRVVHDVPADAEVMYYGFALFGGGSVWIDDVRVSVVDESQPLSHQGSVKGNPNIAIDPTWVLPAPLNLDFELTSSGPSGGAEASHPDCTPATDSPAKE